jgi:hypothetical protein
MATQASLLAAEWTPEHVRSDGAGLELGALSPDTVTRRGVTEGQGGSDRHQQSHPLTALSVSALPV